MKTKAQIVTEYAERLYGEQWTHRLAAFTGVNLRTVQRTRAAFLLGEEYGAAGGLLDALHDALIRACDDLTREVGLD